MKKIIALPFFLITLIAVNSCLHDSSDDLDPGSQNTIGITKSNTATPQDSKHFNWLRVTLYSESNYKGSRLYIEIPASERYNGEEVLVSKNYTSPKPGFTTKSYQIRSGGSKDGINGGVGKKGWVKLAICKKDGEECYVYSKSSQPNITNRTRCYYYDFKAVFAW